MDLIFWVPWLLGFIVFVLWISEPIREFRRLWDKHQSGHENPPGDG